MSAMNPCYKDVRYSLKHNSEEGGWILLMKFPDGRRSTRRFDRCYGLTTGKVFEIIDNELECNKHVDTRYSSIGTSPSAVSDLYKPLIENITERGFICTDAALKLGLRSKEEMMSDGKPLTPDIYNKGCMNQLKKVLDKTIAKKHSEFIVHMIRDDHGFYEIFFWHDKLGKDSCSFGERSTFEELKSREGFLRMVLHEEKTDEKSKNVSDDLT